MFRILAIALLLASPLVAQAQAPVDLLSRCLADNTSGKDRKAFARWMFFAMAAHPEIKQYTSATAAQATQEANKAMAATFTRLLTDSCAQEARTAPKEALEGAFRSFGELAMQELASDHDVKAALSAFEMYLDKNKLDQVLGGK